MSSSSTSVVPPPPQDAKPIVAASLQSKKKAVDKKGSRIRMKHSPLDTLEARCRSVIAANLERYPPEALGILSQVEWDSVVRERNEKTTPTTGMGGLDGTGRLLPAISDRFLTLIERTQPHFADSTVADQLAWQDCVEYRFHSGGVTRPAALQYPWPVLVNKVKRSGDALLGLLNSDRSSGGDQENLERHVLTLIDTPMNVSLLQATGVGKAVKKFIKACAKAKQFSWDAHAVVSSRKITLLALLEETLQRWKHMAATSGEQLHKNDGLAATERNKSQDDQADLRLAESCQSWRELFLALQQREEKRRANQGKRMREIRKNLATGRPRVIKVRPTKSRHDNILERAEKKKGATPFVSSTTNAPAFSSGNAKMRALKKESRIATTLQKSAPRPTPQEKNSFGAAVAFATNTKPTGPTKRRAGQVVSIGGGKRMKLPGKKVAKKSPFPSRH